MRFPFFLIAAQLLFSCYAHDHHQLQPSRFRQPDWTSQRMMHGYSFLNDQDEQAAVIGSAKNGKGIYAQNCAPCHGATGVGNGEHAQHLEARPADLTKYPPWHQSRHFFILISVGTRSVMPGWENLLSRQQIADVIAYIQTL